MVIYFKLSFGGVPVFCYRSKYGIVESEADPEGGVGDASPHQPISTMVLMNKIFS